jgi:aryl-alcohol dehydrogenase-like predicted oxidoreductase
MTLRRNRDDMVIATKYSFSKQNEQQRTQSNYGGNNTKSLRISVENSLANLQTSYIDILYLHWWDYATTIPEVMHSLNDLIITGKVLYLSISDTPAWIVSKPTNTPVTTACANSSSTKASGTPQRTTWSGISSHVPG